MPESISDNPQRQRWMAILAKAEWPRLHALWRETGLDPAYQVLRGPETGLVMTRGRMGGSGAPFNLGEVTVTRCSIRVAEAGTVGHAYVMGRNGEHARTAALLDGLMQHDRIRPRLENEIIAPLEHDHAAKMQLARSKAAATKVDFFTMVRGED